MDRFLGDPTSGDAVTFGTRVTVAACPSGDSPKEIENLLTNQKVFNQVWVLLFIKNFKEGKLVEAINRVNRLASWPGCTSIPDSGEAGVVGSNPIIPS